MCVSHVYYFVFLKHQDIEKIHNLSCHKYIYIYIYRPNLKGVLNEMYGWDTHKHSHKHNRIT